MSELTPEQRGIAAAPAERLLPAVTPAEAEAVAARYTGALALHPKTTGSGLMACVALIALYAASRWVVVPPEVAAAFASILGFVGAYFAPWVETHQPDGQ